MRQLASIAILFALSVAGRSLARREAPPPLPPVRVSLPPDYVRIVSLSYDSIAADILWIRFLQRLPMRPAEDELGRSLASELQSVVTLDPDFRVAHLEGSILLSILGNQQCAALRIAQQGARRFPSDWRLDFQAGYICFAELRDTGCAARHMTAASKNPDAPQWLPRLVARLLAEDSQLDAAIEYLAGQAQHETDPRVKEHVVERLREAILTRDLGALDEAIRTYRLKTGSVPPDWDALVAAGLLKSAPAADPFGGRYEIGSNARALSTSGHVAMRAFRREDGLLGTTREKINGPRVEGRLESILGKPPMVIDGMDRLRANAGDVSAALQALELVREIEPEREEQVRVVESRIILRQELTRLQRAYVETLRRRPDRKPSIDELAAEAGISPHDPFGDSYVFDNAGLPSAAPRRIPLVALRGVLSGGSTTCQ